MAQATVTDVEMDNQIHPEFSVQPSDRLRTPLPKTRRPFHREKSWSLPASRYDRVDQDEDDVGLEEDGRIGSNPQGLGLTDVPFHNATAPEIRRVPVGSRSYSVERDSPGFGGFSQATTAQNTANLEQDTKWQTPRSSRVSFHDQPYQHSASDVNLLPHKHGQDGCPTQGDLLKTQWTGFTLMIIFLAVYSTLFSAIFLFVAIAKPRWGHRIGPKGAISYDTATLLSALFSKTVELTFATTFIVTLGQVLTRRAFSKSRFSRQNKGISIAEMNMRLWIMQPGTLFTHATGARHAVFTSLGVAALTAAFASNFYTTAAEALASPKLKFGNNETLTMFGEVSTSYANPTYLTQTCATPITSQMDPENYGITCLQVDLAGNGFRNLDSWLATWHARLNSNLNIATLSATPRPLPIAILFENTTVSGQWINPSGENMTEDSAKYKRLVQNVTLAMPHANIAHASRLNKNQILQPEDLQGAGEYYVKTAVTVPALNVLCAGATEAELEPLVVNNVTNVPPQVPFTSVFDEIFEWTQDPVTQGGSSAPWFLRHPSEYNTIVNTSGNYGPEAVYLLGKKPVSTAGSDYIICALRSFTYSDCSTAYHVAQSGGRLSVHCGNDPENWKSYKSTAKKNETLPMFVRSKDWKNVGAEWIRSVSLSAGNANINASSARLMTQLVPPWVNGTDIILNPLQPTIAEALGVLASYTLLLSSDASQFVHYWDYPTPALENPAVQSFNAILSYKDYASGGDKNWKGIFYCILAAVFIQNCFCLVYLLWTFGRDGELTDYTEPQNLFALAINSPPSQMLAGACGGGPAGEVLGRKWCVDMDITDTHHRDAAAGSTTPGTDRYNHNHNNQSREPFNHPHFYIRYPDEDTPSAYNNTMTTTTTTPSPRNRWTPSFLSPRTPSRDGNWTPLLEMKRRSPKNRRAVQRPKSMQDISSLVVDESPAVAQYRRLVQ